MVDPQNDPLGFLSFLNRATKTRIVRQTTDWSAELRLLRQEFPNSYVMLGDETLLTDTSAEFVIYTDDVGSATGA